MATFRIKKSKKGYTVIQTNKSVYTGGKKVEYNLGTFRTKAEANKTKRISRQLVK